ncbi:MAG: transposase [Planctomycetota bacterium]
MNQRSDPIAFFITWTVYGTFLQGDSRWWRKKGAGSQAPQPRLEAWHRDRLVYEVILLDFEHRQIVQFEVSTHCERRGWKLWAMAARTNHVHIVVSAPRFTGKKVRDQLKANCTRGIRQIDSRFTDRPVWTTNGDIEFIDSEWDLCVVTEYVNDAQDRMHLGK